MPRAERREQILAAATKTFACTGFAATSLDQVAERAGISRVILYRHFDTKADLYRAVLDRACTRLAETVGSDSYTGASIVQLLRAASDDPDAFRLLFRHATREPEFRDQVDRISADSTEVAHRHLAAMIPDDRWAGWAARLAPVITIECVLAWLDAGQPDPAEAAVRIQHAVSGLIQAATMAVQS
jgi:AcrR family transcriptional regulator